MKNGVKGKNLVNSPYSPTIFRHSLYVATSGWNYGLAVYKEFI